MGWAILSGTGGYVLVVSMYEINLGMVYAICKNDVLVVCELLSFVAPHRRECWKGWNICLGSIRYGGGENAAKKNSTWSITLVPY